jgi:hypothetical protein
MDANTLNTADEDECCQHRLMKALLANANLKSPWDCPKCGTEWRGEMIEGTNIRHWQPHVEFAVIKPCGA